MLGKASGIRRIALFREKLGYDYLGGWTGCANSNIEIMRAFARLRQMLALTPTFS
ncbi:MAG: hypothetical protein NUV63_06600 [Gallionella sp.]|nr:hypothetical protein [Gallionella sp.]